MNFNVDTFSLLLAGVGTTVAMQLKEYPRKIYDLLHDRYVFKASIYNYDSFYEMVEKWVYDKYPSSYRRVSAEAIMDKSYEPKDKPDKDIKAFNIRHETGKTFIKYDGKILFLSKDREKQEHTDTGKKNGGYIENYSISGFLAKKQVLKLLKEILDFNVSLMEENIVKIHSNNDWGWECVNRLDVKPLSKIMINDEVKEDIINDLNDFIQSERWYDLKNISYKRNYMFYGPPGNGKTSLAIALAKKFKLDVFYMNVSNITSDSQLFYLIKSLKQNSILLIEDVDKLFYKDDEDDGIRESKTRISFSTFINCMDGALYKRGLICIFTTNHIDSIDPALLRTGRTDKKINIDNPTEELIKMYYDDFYDTSLDISLVKGVKGMPMSKIQEICISNRNDPEYALSCITSN